MILEYGLKFAKNDQQCVFRTLQPQDVTENYILALQRERRLIENSFRGITIEWQQKYIRNVIDSPCDSICGLFVDSELIGTVGAQNLSKIPNENRPIEMSTGSTADCTMGIFVFSESSRGMGWGKALVWLCCYLISQIQGIQIYKACILKDNLPSIKTFLACGFKITERGPLSVDVKLCFSHLPVPDVLQITNLKMIQIS